ncbi:phosphate signaling complex protein PhoU [Streptacidiphilus jiangxiensis]|uniref:Phosphate transport system protein n=1 Tax=Streptacidiphilus jiangxiensis TaxID=235985 RepID=A0A1H7MZL4_STRJI|nr:phosphate signaling complex protein PhoU [Streptacidiphilus jiangxiensis]SEL16155.1 phosphate transport system protein [Streptacidiphilus jiangxiensis]
MGAAAHEELAEINEGLVRMARLAGSAMGRATTALLDADLQLAESVIAADEALDLLQRQVEERAIAVLEQRQPVGEELRTVVTALRVSSSLERAGDLAQHVAKLARLRYPDAVVPDDLHSTVLDMGQLAQRLMAKAADVIITQDAKEAARLEAEDDIMDDLHRVLFQHLIDRNWNHGVETAVDVTLAGRFYERFADHAVTAAGRISVLAAAGGTTALTSIEPLSSWDFADTEDPGASPRHAAPSDPPAGDRPRRRAWSWPRRRA